MIETINLSTYELLVRPIIDTPDAPNRTVIQGYFLTISNPSLSALQIQLSFKAQTPDFRSSPIVAFWDVDGTNDELSPSSGLPCLRNYSFDLGPLDTGLFLLLPDVREEKVIPARNTEIRGYVRLSITSSTNPLSGKSSSVKRTLVLSAQQRGTFLPQGEDVPPEVGDYDQFSYSLPLATGGAEVTLETVVTSEPLKRPVVLPSRERIFAEIEENPAFLRNITSEPLAQRISELRVEEQRRMVDVVLDRLSSQSSIRIG
ncbi:hypothetical protein [cf. Phormidesmis sp. LEGE 11477]|uniref:hypothetical protein n=1 Tax=cf. Phormidesmis sp. LEGE 11477 TaxID=1828680 RepID=UPI00187E0309|nr:hypothetical protein [cf. Phormidesmis sp. LEGE 11477]MBE9063447.1 hypothetical protein [cf. Phormidesmis sp. LEGE 11477]